MEGTQTKRRRGFAVMSAEQQREIASQGGKASARRQGFASMSAERRREIASKGGRTAWQLGRAHRWTAEEAGHAGRIGGTISKRRPGKPKGYQ